MAKKKSTNLTLSIKRQYFDEILSGARTQEERMVWPDGIGRYCAPDAAGRPVLEVASPPAARAYGTITFLTGAYRGTRPRMVVEVLGAAVRYLTFAEVEATMGAEMELGDGESPGDVATYEYDDGARYPVAMVRYELGAVLERPAGE